MNDKLQEIAVTLENDRDFYLKYVAPTTGMAGRVSLIRNKVRVLVRIMSLDPMEVETLRGYFDARYQDELRPASIGPWIVLTQAHMLFEMERAYCVGWLHHAGRIPEWLALQFDQARKAYQKNYDHSDAYMAAASVQTIAKGHPSHINQRSEAAAQPRKDDIMKFTTQYLLNGVSIATMEKSAVYAAIKAEEDRIAKLGEIKNKPKALVAEIVAGELEIQRLVTHLDAQ